MKKHESFFFVIGICLFLSEILKQISLITYYGHIVWWNIPFQLCSIPMYLCLLLPFLSKSCRTYIYVFLMSFGLMGGMLAFFDTTGMHYAIGWLTIHSYLWHIVLIIIGFYAGFVYNSKCNGTFSLTSFVSAAMIYGLCCVIAEIINLSFESFGEINMFYINPHHEMSQIVFVDIAKKTSTTCSIILYICCSVFGAFLLFNSLRYPYRLLQGPHDSQRS